MTTAVMHFGVEIEAFLPRTTAFLHDAGADAPIVAALRSHMMRLPAGPSTEEAAGDNPALPSLAIPREVRYYPLRDAKKDLTFECWKVTTDDSIRGNEGESIAGLEFITPKLPFTECGIEALRHFVLGIGCGGFAANETTGVHVHVSCEHLTNAQVRRFAAYLIAFEHVFDRFLSPRRRLDNNRYTRSNLVTVAPDGRRWRDAVTTIEQLDVDEAIDSLVECLNVKLAPVRGSERNHKVNFTLLRGTRPGDTGRRVEFRQHHGSTDPHLVCDWARLCVKFLAATAHHMHSPTAFARPYEAASKRDDDNDDDATRATTASTWLLPEGALWALIGDSVLEHRFRWHAEAAGCLAPSTTYESREYIAGRDDAYSGGGE
jgi:hypothetical protein